MSSSSCNKQSNNQNASEKAEEYKRGWVLPGFKYCGPGNSLNQGPPNNEIDRVAMDHDYKYDDIDKDCKENKNCKFEENVRKADLEFVEQLGVQEPECFYHKLVKGLCLATIGLKTLVEPLTGVMYPINPNTGFNIWGLILVVVTIILIVSVAVFAARKLVKYCKSCANNDAPAVTKHVKLFM